MKMKINSSNEAVSDSLLELDNSNCDNDTGYSNYYNFNSNNNNNNFVNQIANNSNQKTNNIKLNQVNLSSSNKPMSPPIELTESINLKKIYRQSGKMNSKIMPNYENTSNCDSIDEMNNSNQSLSFDDPINNQINLNEVKCESERINDKLNSLKEIQRSNSRRSSKRLDEQISQQLLKKKLNRHFNQEKDRQLFRQLDLQSSEDDSSLSVQSVVQSYNKSYPVQKSIDLYKSNDEFVYQQQSTSQPILDLNLKSTLNHALESKYAYLSFEDSFNIEDYQSFDSEKSSRKNRNLIKLSNLNDSFNSNNNSFNTSFDLVDIENKESDDKLNKSIEINEFIDEPIEAINNSIIISPQLINKSNQSIRNIEENLSIKDVKDINQNENNNYIGQKLNKKFQFKNFVDTIRFIKIWATTDNKQQNQEAIKEEFNLTLNSSKPEEEKKTNFLCFGNLVVDSNRSPYYYWLIIVSFAILYNLLMIVGRSTFWELQNNYTNLWIFLDYFCDFIYLIDICVNARTAYLEQGLLVRDTKKLWTNYYHSSSFKLDILSSLPTDFYLFYTGLFCDYNIPCSIIIRLNRLIKIYRLIECFDKIELKTNYPNAFRISKMIFIILVVIHWNGCLYFYVSYLIGFSIDKWTFNLTANPDFSDQYIYCFYWSTLTLTAIGEVPPPVSDIEYLFVTFNFLIGVLIFATIVGNVGSMITNMNQNRAEFQSKMDAVKQYMEFRHISKTLENRVIKWFDYLWQNKQSLDEESVLNVLPDKLKTEIAVHVHLSTLEKVKLFEGVDNRLLEQLVLKLRLQVFSPGDYVCRKGDVGKEMYIVKKGRLSVVSEDGQKVFANLTDGAVFGELSVLNIQGNKTGNKRSANVRSVGYSDLFCLNKLDLMQVLEEYPEAKEMLIERGKEILRKDGLLDEDKLREEEQMKENLLQRLEQITTKYEQMTNKFARFIAEYSVSQRKLKKRIYQLEKNFDNNKSNKISLDEEINQTINLND